MSQEYYVGVDIGGTKILAVILNASGHCLGQIQEPTRTEGGEALANQVLTLATSLMASHNKDISDLKGLGVGLPASVDPQTKSLSHIPNIKAMEGTSFYYALKARFSCPIYLENDVNTAAFAEFSAAPSDPIVFIAIGTGIGMGMIGGGQLLRGHLGAAGEIAYLPLGGKIGGGGATLEARLGGNGWRKAYEDAGGAPHTELGSLFATPDEIFNVILDDQVELLAQALLTIWAVVAPQRFVLGGSIGGQNRLLSILRAKIAHYIPNPIEITASKFGQNAGAVGAGLLCITTSGSV